MRVVEFAGLAPAPFAAMLLADLGADVIRIDRARTTPHGAVPLPPPLPTDILGRGRRSVALNLKHPEAVALIVDLVQHADVLIEGFRPGVMEKLGLGPDVCGQANPRLIYGRMTGWGQHGPLAATAGHDIDYIAVSGALHLIGEAGGAPVPPANLLGDFAGGGLLLAFGLLAAIHERGASGRGQVVDAAMVDGAALLTTMLHGLRHAAAWLDERGSNVVDGGAPYYGTYETSDGRFVAVGAVEPEFYAEFVHRLGIDVDPAEQNNRETWSRTRALIAESLRARTRDHWCAVFADSDGCVAPVLSLAEAPGHPHNLARGTFTPVAGVVQPAPAPRFGRTPPAVPSPPPAHGEHGPDSLTSWGTDSTLIDTAIDAGVLVAPEPWSPTRAGR